MLWGNGISAKYILEQLHFYWELSLIVCDLLNIMQYSSIQMLNPLSADKELHYNMFRTVQWAQLFLAYWGKYSA